MGNFYFRFAISFFALIFSIKVFATECAPVLAEEVATDVDFLASMEEFRLEDLITADPEKNLAFQHPFMVMGAPQRVKSLIYYKASEPIYAPGYTNKRVRMFPVLSTPMEENKGKLIIGKYEQVEAAVKFVDAQADGRPTSKLLTYLGPPGTGKTEFLNILLEVAKYLQTHDSRYFSYTYEWKNLLAIPDLVPFVNFFELDEGKRHEFAIKAPLRDSPFVLLPPGTQKNLLKMVNPKVQEMIGIKANPWNQRDPQSEFIRNAIIRHYAKEEGKARPTDADIVRYLSKHIRIKRHIVGEYGQSPKINAEGGDVDWNGLFYEPNPAVKLQYGSDHPFAYWLNGKVAQFHGLFGFLDEWWRNRPELRDTFLEILQNKVISRGGAPTIYLDFVPIAASNDESVKAAKEKTQSRAQLDRSKPVIMRYSPIPHEVAATALQMWGAKRLYMQSLKPVPGAELGAPNTNEIVPARLEELFPISKSPEVLLGPDHRYKLFVKYNGKDIHVSPHSMMYMAYIAGATRLNVDVAAAKDLGMQFTIINGTEFRDPITRLKILTRQRDANPGERMELEKLSELLKEGVDGLGNRDISETWLEEAVSRAAQGDGVITPLLLKEVFLQLLRQELINFPDHTTRLKWFDIADNVAYHFTVPAFEDDINSGTGQGVGSAESIYEELLGEMDALERDPNADKYFDLQQQERIIDKNRLAEIKQIYTDQYRQPLVYGHILSYQLRSMQTQNGEDRRHQPLLSAIRRYLAKAMKKLVSTDALLRAITTKEGNTQAKTVAASVSHHLIHRLGYCEVSMKQALEFIAEYEEKFARRQGP